MTAEIEAEQRREPDASVEEPSAKPEADEHDEVPGRRAHVERMLNAFV